MPAPLDAITQFIRDRRSLKPAAMDPDRQIPRPLLETLLENATWAPTHGLTEPWHFTVFSGDSRSALADRLQAIYREHVPAEDFRQDKFDKLGTNPRLAPVVIAIGVTPGSNPKIPEIEEIEAVACAVQNLHLSAAAAGLGAFWSSPPITSHPDFLAFLDLGGPSRCLGLLYLGWPRPGAPEPVSKRSPLSEKTVWR